MRNNKMMNLNLTRGQVCDVLRALTHMKIDFTNEIRDKSITEIRREIAESSLAMWESLHNEIKNQLDKYDKELVSEVIKKLENYDIDDEIRKIKKIKAQISKKI